MKRKVIRIIDGDTFEVAPGWEWEGLTGSVVRPVGYDTPEWGEPGYREARDKLKRLILNKEVELKDPIKLSYERLLCYVIFQGKDLAGYFI
jgi:endonuclease YncB( thermonuclease family)